MRATPEQRDERRVERWRVRFGQGLDHVSPEVYDLLRLRLRACRRAYWICSPFFLAAMALFVSEWWLIDGRPEPDLAGRFVLGLLLTTSGLVLAAELGRRADGRIGARLAHRVTREEPVPFWWMLGRLRSALLIVTASGQVILAVVLARVGPGWLARDYAIGLSAAGVLAGLGIWRAATRPTLAVDGVSLAIDERLRSEDAYSATGMLHVLIFVLPMSSGNSLPIWFADAVLASIIVVQGLWTWGRAKPPWKPAFRTAGY